MFSLGWFGYDSRVNVHDRLILLNSVFSNVFSPIVVSVSGYIVCMIRVTSKHFARLLKLQPQNAAKTQNAARVSEFQNQACDIQVGHVDAILSLVKVPIQSLFNTHLKPPAQTKVCTSTRHSTKGIHAYIRIFICHTWRRMDRWFRPSSRHTNPAAGMCSFAPCARGRVHV